VERVATFVWRTPPPTSVDEEMAVFDDGSARLVVRRPRLPSAAVGTYLGHPGDEDLRALSAAGPGPVTFDLRRAPDSTAEAQLLEVANRVADVARQTALAVAEFYARPLPSEDPSVLPTSLMVVASGTQPVEFELDPRMLAIHFAQAGQPVAWRELPEPAMGFMTPDAEGLGGLRSAAEVDPGRYGAILFTVESHPGATSVDIQVGGWLRNALPDHPMPEPFEVRTSEAEIQG